MKKLLLGLGTIAAITAPVVSVVACGSRYSAKYVSSQDEGRELISNILDDAISASADISYNAFISKDFGDHPGFTLKVRFKNESGSGISGKNNMYEYLCHQVWDKMKANFLNPFQVSFSSSDLFVADEFFGYAHGCESLWTNSPSHDDGQLYIR